MFFAFERFKEFDAKEQLMVKFNDAYVKRIILSANEGKSESELIENALRALLENLAWRKKQQVYKIEAKDIPREFFEFGHVTYGKEIGTRRRVIKVNSIINRKLAAFNRLLLDWSLYVVETHFADTSEGILINDASQLSFSSLDYESTLKSYDILANYPAFYGKIIASGMPRIVLPFMNLIKKAMPISVLKIVHFTNELPDYEFDDLRGGMPPPPDESPNLESLLRRHGEDEKTIQKCLEHLRIAKEQFSFEKLQSKTPNFSS